MNLLRGILALGALALIALIIWAAGEASIWASFPQIWSNPWGKVTIVDLYLGFVVASVVVCLVERPAAAAAWIVALLVLGNVVSAAWLALRLPRLVSALRSAR